MPTTRSASRLLVAAACSAVVLPVVSPASAASTAGHKTTSAASAASSLVAHVRALPSTSVSVDRRGVLLRDALHARASIAHHPCVAVKDLTALRTTLRKTAPRRSLSAKVTGRTRHQLQDLGTSSLKVSTLLLTGKATAACGGGRKTPTVTAPTTTVMQDSMSALSVHIALPTPTLTTVAEGGRSWARVGLPGAETSGAPGTPGVPVVSHAFAVPPGATVSLRAVTTTGYTLDGVDLYPVQPETADGSQVPLGPFLRHGFSVDAAAYRHKGYTAGPQAGSLGRFRDVQLGRLQIPAVQFDAARHTLKVLSGVDATISFAGGAAAFSPELSSPYEKPQRDLAAGLMNGPLVLRPSPYTLPQCGEEMLVVSEPSLHGVATRFVNAKNAQGLRTALVEVKTAAGGTIGDDVASIQAYVRSQLTAKGCIHPSYVTILGDQTLVPTDSSFSTMGDGTIDSDLPYSLADGADELPDVALGRIPGSDATLVGQSVDKILGYENTPPTDPGFLSHATVAGFFQDASDRDKNGNLYGVDDGKEERTFIQFTEQIRTALLARGDTVDRVYTRDGASSLPTTFSDGTSLPGDLQKFSAWKGTGADIAADWNAGRFLVVHRDHGYNLGFSNPQFTTTDLPSLTNTNAALPLLLSINCASGQYSNGESFVAQVVDRKVGGAVGAFGDTDNSPSYENTQLALGFADALLPSVLPEEGTTTHLRVGQALVSGKLRLADQELPSLPGAPGDPGASRQELYLWHYFGDPSMQLWGGGNDPVTIDVHQITASYLPVVQMPGPDPEPFYQVKVSLPAQLEGQTVAVLNKGVVVGKAAVTAGAATVAATFGDSSPAPGDLTVALAPDGAAPVSAPVSGTPKQATSLSQDCSGGSDVNDGSPIPAKGTLAGAPAGADVAVTFTYDQTGEQHVVHATTGADGSWTASYTSPNSAVGTWHTRAAYAGTDRYAAAQSAGCTTTVHSFKP